MSVFLWIIQLISPVAIVFGGLYLLEDPSPVSLIAGVISTVIGLLIGTVGWKYTIPPRWFWIRSSVELTGSRFTTAIGYAIQFFFITLAIFAIVEHLMK